MATKHKQQAERGVALLIAIFTLLLLTAIGAGMIMLTNTDTSISANFRDEQTAFFAAKAGMEEVRDRLRSTSSNPLFTSLPTALPGNANAFVYVLNPKGGETDTPWVTNGAAYPDDEVCTEMANMGNACTGNPPVPAGGTWYKTPSPTASASYAMSPVANWKWTRINLKTNKTSSGSTTVSTVDGNTSDNAQLVCWTGANEITTTLATCAAANPNYQPVYVMTTLAVTPSGSRRMVQAEAAATVFPSIPGPLVFDGAGAAFAVPNSNNFIVNGNDASGPSNARGLGLNCPASEPPTYALGAFDAADLTALQSAANATRPNNYTGIGNPTGTTNVASAGDVSAQLGTLATVGGLESLVSSVTLVAGNEGNVYGNNPGGITNPGTPASPQVNVVQGNLSLGGNWSGSGILLVTGNLTISGTLSYNGLILVVGTGSITKNGGGNATDDGSILMANLYDSSGHLLPASGHPGAPNFTWNGGGTMTMNYDSCWSSVMNNSVAYRIVAVREMMY